MKTRVRVLSLAVALVGAACGGSSPGGTTPTGVNGGAAGTWVSNYEFSGARRVGFVLDLHEDSRADMYIRWAGMESREVNSCKRISGKWVYANGKLTLQMVYPENVPVAGTGEVDFPRAGTMRIIDRKGATALLERGPLGNVSDCTPFDGR